MSIEEFQSLSEEERKIVIFEAEKVSEREDATSKYELFKIDNFYIQVKTSISHSFKRIIETLDGDKKKLFIQ